MLNEGYLLVQSLKRCGIPLTRRHPDVKEPGKKEGLIIGLGPKGKIESIEYRPPGEVTRLWTVRKGNHNSFPIWQTPLLNVSSDIRQQLLDPEKDDFVKKKLLTELSENISNYNDDQSSWKKLQDEVRRLRPYFDTKDPIGSALPVMMDRFLLIRDPKEFYRELIKHILDSELQYSCIENALIGRWNKKKNRAEASIAFILDVSDWHQKSRYASRVASSRMESFVSECLFKRDQSKVGSNSRGISALSGKVLSLETDKFPCPKLPVLGNAYLFSVNDQTPCQTRYGRTRTDIIPVGREEANAIQDALNWTTDELRRGKTWYPVPGIQEDKSDLLLVYLESKPDLLIDNALLLGGMSNSDFTESHYEEVSKQAIETLKGRAVDNPSDLIQMFSLRKADLGRTKVALHRTYTIEEVIRSDEEWRMAARNIPSITIPIGRREIKKIQTKVENLPRSLRELSRDPGAKVLRLSPAIPFPSDLVRLTQWQWAGLGKDSTKVTGISLGDVYDVYFMLQAADSSFVKYLLNKTLRCVEPLLVGYGAELHRKSELLSFSRATRMVVLLAVVTLGIYLHKLGIKKEKYMKNTFYYLGRFLSLVDTLHYEYCDKVRKSIPPQLLGNAHLQIALDNPTAAVDLLSRRIGIYQAWAKKERSEEGSLARWAISQLGRVTDVISESPLPTKTQGADRAQILLGYLAWPERKADITPESVTTNQPEK